MPSQQHTRVASFSLLSDFAEPIRCRLLIFFAAAVLALGSARGQTGLTGQYYDNADFTTLKTTRTDATVNFNWGTGIPSGTTITNADTFSVAWTGQIEPQFSELYTFYVAADDGARLWIDDRLVGVRTFAQTSEMRGQARLTAGQRVNVRLEFIEQTGSASVKLEWSSPSRAREVIPQSRLFTTRLDKAGGSILKEHWSGITGTAISSLTSNANYPNKPSGREMLTSFECLAQSWADSYGTRVTGYVVPPASGSYTFAVAADDTAELYLSTDSNSANKALIANVSSATGFRVWTAQGSQQSAPRTLVQGTKYYVELLHKEGTGGDHFSVGWKKPGDSVFSVIPGDALVQAGIDRTQPSPQSKVMDTVARDHPRIFATPERFAWLKAIYLSPTSSTPKTWAQSAITTANSILTQPPVDYAPDVRGTILAESRTVKDRMYNLGLAWWLTGDSAYAERAWTELNTVADNTLFPDWHPPHFLDTAEMTHACAIGYDWFYTYWTQARRDTIRTAIINKGLNAGSTEYANATWWTLTTSNNWNCVCNGGLSLGALAVGTESEALTEDILTRAMNSLRPVMSHFTTDDGAWFEGPGYWAYATEYNSRMMAGLEWVLGSDFGLSKTRALSESGYYAMAGTGPFGQQFNFADSGTGRMTEDTLQWQARRFNQPLVGWYENTYGSGVLDALWWNDRPNSPSTAGLPPDFAFHGDAGTGYNPQEIVTLRGNWSDTRATFAGAKAGLVGESHGDLDQGCFVLDALGKRWFTELGSDDYALPGYFTTTPNPSGDDRWDYYRTRGEGQNTLIVNPGSGPDMVLGAFAPLLAYQSEPGGQRSMAIYDLTPAHSGMTRVWRGFQLLGDRKQMLVQDEIVASTGKTVWWFAHYTYPTTTVTIEAGATSVMLTQGAERLWCKIVSGGGTFQIKDATPLPSSPIPSQGQNTNTGYKKLAINLTGVTNTTLAVWMVPLEAGEIAPTTLPTITPLSSWNLAGSDAPTSNDGGATGIADNSVDIDLRNYSSDDATPTDQLRFSLGAAANGTVTLLADGHTARFTPTAGYTGVPSFDFTVTDTTPDSRMLLAYDFDLPDAASTTIASDVTGNFRDGTIDYAGAGVFALVNDKPAQLGGQGTRSIDLTEDGTNAVRVQRLVTTSELNFNTQDWTVAGWFKRRDTTNDDFVWHISNGDGFGSNDELYVNCPAGATTVRLQHYSAAAVGFDVDIPMTGITAGTWHHFAVVRSGTTLNFYVDGALAGSDSAFALVLDQTYPVIFGGHAVPTFQPGRWFDGQLDDCAVFTAALSSTEVGTLAGGMTVRHFGGLSATGTITLSATPTTSVWTATTSGAWSTGANWSSATAPASSRGATLEFFTGQTLGTGTVTANNDLGAFSLNVLTLAGTTSAAANAAIAGGALTLTNNGALNPVVNLNATNGAGFTYDVSNALTLAVATTFQGSGSATFRFNGNLSGVGALTKSGTSTLILTGTNSYAGGTTISAGTLQIGNNAATGTLAAGAVTDNGTLRFHRSDTALVVANAISGTGALQFGVSTGGTLAAITTLSGTNSFTGGVTVFSGAARITNSSALGTGTKTITLTNGSAGNPNLRLDGSGGNIVLPSTISFTTSNNNTTNGAILNELGNNTINGPISLYSGGGDTKIVVVAGTLTLAGAIAPTTTSRSLILGGAGTGTVNGAISDGTGSNVLVGLRKDDAGTWTLTGPVTHTGTVTVNAGTLAVNSSVSGPSSFTVASAAKLSGTGSIATNTTISGTHQPGAGLGTQTFTGTLTYGSASRLSWELGGNTDTGAGTNFDRVAAAGVTVTSGGKVDLVFNSNGSTVNFTNAFWTQNRTWTVLTASSISGTFTLGTISADSAGNSFTSFGTFSLQQTATAVNVLWTPAPSPGFAESGTSGGGTLVVTTGNGTTSSNTDGTASGATHAFAASAGNYAGLLTTTQPPLEYVGLARFAVNSRGHFSGTIWFESAPLPVRGKFSADGNYSGLIRRGQRALLALTLRLPEAQTDGLFGTLSDGVASTAITAQRTAFDPASNACPQAGSYQVELAGAEGDVPQATGEVLVRPNGSVSFRGLLADGTAVSQGTWLSRDGAWPFYRPLYAHRGYIAGPQVFEELGTSQLDGLLDWVAPPRLTAGGFRTRLSLTGQTIEIAPRTKRR